MNTIFFSLVTAVFGYMMLMPACGAGSVTRTVGFVPHLPSRITVPTLVVQATGDPELTPAQAKARIASAYDILSQFHAAEEASGYQVDKLLAAL